MTTLTIRQVARVAYAAGFRGEGLVTAAAVAMAESSGRVEVVNSIGCVGLWQINQPVHVSAHPKWTRAWLQTAAHNAEAAFVLSAGGRRWGPWTVYTSGSYRRFLPAARSAATAAAASGSAPGPRYGGSRKDKDDEKPPPKPDPPKRVEDDPDPRTRLGRLYLHGGRLAGNVQEAVTGATLSWSTSEVTQLTVNIADPGFALFRTGLFEKGTAVLYREPRDGTYPGFDLNLRVTAISLDAGPSGTGGMTVQARSEGVWKLKRRRGPKVMKKVSPTEFVEAECKAVGLRCVAQPSAKRGQVARDVAGKGEEEASGSSKPSSWTTFGRLATELGYYVFEFADTVYFGKPTWLIDRDDTPLQVALPLAGAPEVWMSRTMPSISMSEDAEVPVSIDSIEVERTRLRECRPGGAVQLRGLQPFNELYLTMSMSMPLLGVGGITLSAATPRNPKPQPPAPPAAAGGSTAGFYDPEDFEAMVGGSGKSAAAFVAVAVSASSARYVYGAEAASSDPTPAALDCSELVQWALGRVGVSFVDGSSAQYAASRKITVSQALATRGALLYKLGHIGISMGDGRSVEARNPSAGVGIFNARDIAWTGGGLVPGLRYG